MQQLALARALTNDARAPLQGQHKRDSITTFYSQYNFYSANQAYSPFHHTRKPLHMHVVMYLFSLELTHVLL